MKRKTREVVVVQEEDKPIARNVLAQEIVNISKAFASLRRSGLTRRAITVLVHDLVPAHGLKGKPSKTIISDVLVALDRLRREFVE